MPHTEVSGVDLYYEITGEGDPLVLIPGMYSDIGMYAGLIRLLAEEYRVIAIDIPMHGRSGMPHSPMSPEEVGAAFAGLCSKLGVCKPIVLGHSAGAIFAIHMARGVDVRKAILVCPAGIVRWGKMNLYSRLAVKNILALIRSPGKMGPIVWRSFRMFAGMRRNPTFQEMIRRGSRESIIAHIRNLDAAVVLAGRDLLFPAGTMKRYLYGVQCMVLKGWHDLPSADPEMLTPCVKELCCDAVQLDPAHRGL